MATVDKSRLYCISYQPLPCQRSFRMLGV